jgi:hypothetical protein
MTIKTIVMTIKTIVMTIKTIVMTIRTIVMTVKTIVMTIKTIVMTIKTIVRTMNYLEWLRSIENSATSYLDFRVTPSLSILAPNIIQYLRMSISYGSNHAVS